MTDEETIAALRRFFDAFNRGDFEAVLQMVHPDVELVRTGGMSSVKGIAALREWMGAGGHRGTTP
jgi:ketosteroid isomerase-like protein